MRFPTVFTALISLALTASIRVPHAFAETYSGALKFKDFKVGTVGPGAEICSTFKTLKVSIEGSKISYRPRRADEAFSADIASNGSFDLQGRVVTDKFTDFFEVKGVFNGKSIVATYTRGSNRGTFTCIYSVVASPDE